MPLDDFGRSPDPGSLLDLFYDPADRPCHLTRVESADLPPACRQLLDHEQHMTVTVESFHQSPVDVRVLATVKDDECYSRRIILTRQSDNEVVQFGIVRLHRRRIPPAALEEIESQRIPLGRVLIQQDVMRHVQLDDLWHVTPHAELKTLFNSPNDTGGRSARIFVDGEPAIELLEIVAPVDDDPASQKKR